MLRGLIFDMDGVLIDSHPVHRRAWREFLASVGKQVREEQLDFILEGRKREEILHYFLGNLPAATALEYGQRKEQFFQENFKDVRLIPGVRQFLSNLEGARLVVGLATSASGYRTRETLKRLKLQKQFSAIVTGDDVHAGKPDPAVYHLASQRMKLPPEELLVLEDAPCGVQAARAAGMRCIGVTSNGRIHALREAGADHVIPDFVDLSIERLVHLWTEITRAPDTGLLSSAS